MQNTWLTNDPVVGEKLKRIDARLRKAREAAKGLCLSDMIVALRKARQEHTEAMAELRKELSN